MSSLPPYSTFRTDNKQMMYPQAISHGNVLTFTPPGFNHTLNVKFPDSRLAVCEKCKKNYKTKDMCRVRNSHTGPPWSTAYICITLDDSCTDENGKYVDKPLTVRMVQWQPFCVKQPFPPESKTPVCSACKKTNRTRSFCRDRHQHRQLPWCTVYVLLSALDKTDPSTVVAAPSQPLRGDNVEAGEKKPDGEKKSAVEGEDDSNAPKSNEEGTAGKSEDITSDETANPNQDGTPETLETAEGAKPDPDETGTSNKQEVPTPKKNRSPEEGDDIDAIEDSRTFLAMVSCKTSSILWVELAEFDPMVPSNGLLNPESTVQALNAAIRNPSMSMPPMNPQQYYAQMAAMGYTPQQQQQAFRMQQQHWYNMQHGHPQHFAQQQAAWQAQYNQQMPPGTPGASGTMPHPSPVTAPGATAPSAPAPGSPANGEEADQSLPSISNVTAGEAAAAKQREQEQNGSGAPAPHPGGSAAQSQAQAQWHAQMMYHQQLYQQQMQMQHAAQQQIMAPNAQAPAAEAEPEAEDGVEPTPLSQEPTDAAELDAVDLHVDDGDGDGGGHDHDAKRQRIDVV